MNSLYIMVEIIVTTNKYTLMIMSKLKMVNIYRVIFQPNPFILSVFSDDCMTQNSLIEHTHFWNNYVFELGQLGLHTTVLRI